MDGDEQIENIFMDGIYFADSLFLDGICCLFHGRKEFQRHHAELFHVCRIDLHGTTATNNSFFDSRHLYEWKKKEQNNIQFDIDCSGSWYPDFFYFLYQ